MFGAIIASGRDHRQVLGYFRPGFDLDAERKRSAAAGYLETFDAADLDPDARPFLTALREMGLWVGTARTSRPRPGNRS